MKIYNGQAGQFGDALMSLRVSQYLREIYPEAEIIGGISHKYSSMLSILKTAPYVNKWILWKGYPSSDSPEFPTIEDKLLIDIEKFDLFFDPNKSNHHPSWYRYCHQVEDMFLRHNIAPPNDLQIYLPKPNYSPINIFAKNTIAFAPFPNNGQGCKCLSVDKAQEIVNFLISIGKQVIQLGGNSEPILKHAIQPRLIPSVADWASAWLFTSEILNSVELLITTDTAVSWLASAYNIKTIGLYGYEGYYSDASSSKNWQPINKNAIYLEDKNCNDIDNNKIFEIVDKYSVV